MNSEPVLSEKHSGIVKDSWRRITSKRALKEIAKGLCKKLVILCLSKWWVPIQYNIKTMFASTITCWSCITGCFVHTNRQMAPVGCCELLLFILHSNTMNILLHVECGKHCYFLWCRLNKPVPGLEDTTNLGKDEVQSFCSVVILTINQLAENIIDKQWLRSIILRMATIYGVEISAYIVSIYDKVSLYLVHV